MKLVIKADGQITCLYGETIDVSALGSLAIRRASHVEPDACGHRWADLAPLSGPKLGPFSFGQMRYALSPTGAIETS